jgi:hypothetical protein
MKTLHIDTGREMRGGQWQALYLVEQLTGKSIDVTLLTPAASPLLAEARKRGIEVQPLSVMMLQRLVRKSDIVHAHDARAHTLTTALPGGKLVVSRRVAFPIKRGILSRLKYGRADLYLAVSRYVAAELRRAGMHEDLLRIVYDGVPIPPKPSTREAGRVVALASKPIEIPGIPIHLTADLWQDLSAASVFVYRSEMEGLGSAALAAMAAGVPVVASHVGGLPEAVEHERTGLLVSDGDFATPIRRLLDNPKEAAEMGRRGRERVEQNFTIDIMVEKTLAAYREVLS